MNKEQAIQYLQNVFDNWIAFDKGHKQFAMALKVLLQEVRK
jgi:hypothetical protein